MEAWNVKGCWDVLSRNTWRKRETDVLRKIMKVTGVLHEHVERRREEMKRCMECDGVLGCAVEEHVEKKRDGCIEKNNKVHGCFA